MLLHSRLHFFDKGAIYFWHSSILTDEDGIEYLNFRYERDNIKTDENDFAEGTMPNAVIMKSFGFNENELLFLEQYLRSNTRTIWENARNGVSMDAESLD